MLYVRAGGHLAKYIARAAIGEGIVKLEPLLQGRLDVSEPRNVGDGPFGRRLVFGITGGTFEGMDHGRARGQAIKGRIAPGGGDWVVMSRNVSHLDIRLTLETDDGFAIYVQAGGLLVATPELMGRITNPNLIFDYDELYFRTQLRFETGDRLDPQDPTRIAAANPYKWLNDTLAAGESKLGTAYPNHVAGRWIEFRWHALT